MVHLTPHEVRTWRDLTDKARAGLLAPDEQRALMRPALRSVFRFHVAALAAAAGVLDTVRLLAAAVLMLTITGCSGIKPWKACDASAGAAATGEPLDPTWEFSLQQKSLINSHTSYEFGNPFPPGQQPLSRLEFPVNSIWGGFELRKKFSRLSVTAGFMSTYTEQDTGGKLIDSDWDDETDPRRLTVYSASPCRLKIGYEAGGDIDLQVADLLHLPSCFDLRPLIGFRWQQFSLVAHDGIQYNLSAIGDDAPVELLRGDGIAFEQNWYRYYLGIRAGYEWRSLSWLHRLQLLTQFDWSYAEGKNIDHHLLRAGNRFTEEHTTGDARHVAVGLLFGITRNLDLGIDADYLSIRTTGSHTLRNELFDINTTWTSGVKVWSEQYGVTVKLGYRF